MAKKYTKSEAQKAFDKALKDLIDYKVQKAKESSKSLEDSIKDIADIKALNKLLRAINNRMDAILYPDKKKGGRKAKNAEKNADSKK